MQLIVVKDVKEYTGNIIRRNEMIKLLKKIFDKYGDTEKCVDDIIQLSKDNLTEDNLKFVRNKYPDELHSWKKENGIIKFRMYNWV